MTTSKICLALFCLLAVRSVGSPEYCGATLSMKKLNIHSKTYGDFIVLYDDEDHELISKYTWHLAPRHHNNQFNYYARTAIYGQNKQMFTMHRLIMRFPENEIDHINMNGLDNRKENLRTATGSQNRMNKGLQKNNTSGFKGVSHTRDGKWKAYIKINRELIQLGTFTDKKEAARKYNEAALQYHGEFARLNIIS